MIVGISGKARAGKNTFGLLLAMNLKSIGVESEQLSFAHRLKKDALLMGWDGEKNPVGRFALQKYGEIMRSKDIDYWIDALGRANPDMLSNHKVYIITDVRYKNEAEWVRKNEGVLIRVERISFKMIDPEYEHISEKDLDKWTDWDWLIKADEGDFKELWESAGKVAEWMAYRL
jgi:hypothetical protein